MELDAILDNLSDEEQIELLELLEEEENYRNTHLLYEFTPYSKQREFIDAGHDYPERCFMAGNQLGKSFTGAAEVAFHLTGRYPGTKGYPADGKYGGEWKGKRFYEPVVFWIGGETNETVTKTTQRILCGRIEENDEPGYGSIPKEDIISWKKSPFFPNLVDHLLVKHHTPEGVEDGISICYFKPYSQGRARWQGDTIHGVWFDEEPPYSIYGEGLTLRRYKQANAVYADEASKLQNTRLKNVLMKGDLTPEVVNNMLFSKNKSEIQNLYNSVGQIGRAQMRNGIIGKAMDKSGGSPDQFLRQVHLMSNQTGIAFKGRDAAYLKGLKNYLESTKRAGQAGVTTPTGQQTIPFILGIGTVTNPALVGVGGGYGLLARMYESEPARNALLRLANTPRGSTAFEKALSDVERIVNSFAQGTKSQSLSE
ncbi:hypothetical protein FNO20_10190 [Salmonella enterica subsp. diarizonae]|nr:hypothetical protein [Salmonella enterica subsp. diarizonae]